MSGGLGADRLLLRLPAATSAERTRLSASADLGYGGIAVGLGGSHPLVSLGAPDDRVRCKRIPVYDWPDQRPPFNGQPVEAQRGDRRRPMQRFTVGCAACIAMLSTPLALQPWTLRASG
jgi:hypothetical protein